MFSLSVSELLFDSCEFDAELDDEDGHSESKNYKYHVIGNHYLTCVMSK